MSSSIEFYTNITDNGLIKIPEEFKDRFSSDDEVKVMIKRSNSKFQTARANYRLLDQLLKTGQWEKANEETCNIILKIIKEDLFKIVRGMMDELTIIQRQKNRIELMEKNWDSSDFLDKQKNLSFLLYLLGADPDVERHWSLELFPKDELIFLDDLWVKYSDGQFGFSVQKAIWLEKDDSSDDLNKNEIPFFYHKYHKCGWIKQIQNWADYGKIKPEYDFKSLSEINFTRNAVKGHLPFIMNLFDMIETFDLDDLEDLYNLL